MNTHLLQHMHPEHALLQSFKQFLSVCMLTENQTHDLQASNAMHYQLNYMEPKLAPLSWGIL